MKCVIRPVTAIKCIYVNMIHKNHSDLKKYIIASIFFSITSNVHDVTSEGRHKVILSCLTCLPDTSKKQTIIARQQKPPDLLKIPRELTIQE